MRQQLGDSGFLVDNPVFIGNDHDRIQPKLGEHLAAGAAGRAAISGNDRDGLEGLLACGDGFEDGAAFGAHGERIDRIFYVGPGVHLAGGGQ